LYTPAWRPVFINLSLGITAALLLFWLLWKLAGRNKGAVSYARASLQEEQLQLLRDLMEGPMNTDELNTALGMGKGTLDSQRKKRSDFIKAINDLGEALYQAQIIDRYKDSVDKRVVYYRINPGVRRHILKLLGQ
jgi:DNA-binding MarR family transcriptional regulator